MDFKLLHNHSGSYTPKSEEVLFINPAQSKCLDDFFSRNLKKVQDLFKEHDNTFIYAPDYFNADYLSNLISYNYPQLSENEIQQTIKSFDFTKFYQRLYAKNAGLIYIDRLYDYLINLEANNYVNVEKRYNEQICHALRKFPKDEQGRFTSANFFSLAVMDEGTDEYIWKQLDNFFNRARCGEITCLHHADDYIVLYSAIGIEDNIEIEYEVSQLSQEIIDKINKLRVLGVNELVIQNLFQASRPLSHIKITKDWRIFLTDYQNKEIKMTPLAKIVFILFLRHPEGIPFKCIADYKNELMELYCAVTGREPEQNMRKSIETLTTPYDNSLNEKCSRIREVFLLQIEDSLAQNYYITGEKSTRKRIKLDRDLVIWENPKL